MAVNISYMILAINADLALVDQTSVDIQSSKV